MVIDLTAGLVVALGVGAWLLIRWRPHAGAEPLPSVGDAPADAEPIAMPRLTDNGLGAYSLELPDATVAARG